MFLGRKADPGTAERGGGEKLTSTRTTKLGDREGKASDEKKEPRTREALSVRQPLGGGWLY